MDSKGGIQQELSRNKPLSMYRLTVIGNEGIFFFLVYEFFVVVLTPIPGRVGIFLRKLFLPYILNHSGRKNVFQRDVIFRRPKQIRIGNQVTLERGVTLDVKGDAGFIEIQDGVHIGQDTILSCPGGQMVIEKGTRIAKQCRLGSLLGLRIGQNTTIDEAVCIVGAGHAFHSRNLPIMKQELTCKGQTMIETDVIIEKGATVLDGVHIGSGATIKAGSLVTSDIPINTVVRGVPAVQE